jgi:hypothetical protein
LGRHFNLNTRRDYVQTSNASGDPGSLDRFDDRRDRLVSIRRLLAVPLVILRQNIPARANFVGVRINRRYHAQLLERTCVYLIVDATRIAAR